jgi:hypothetical protein
MLPPRSTAAFLALFLVACAGSGHQRIPMPPLGSSVPADRCRVFVAREDTPAGSLRNIRVFDGETEVGVIDEGEFLCWERRPQRGVGRVVFEGLSPDTRAVESVFDLLREAGAVGYYSIRILHSGHKPEVTPLREDEGKALVARRKPAPVE